MIPPEVSSKITLCDDATAEHLRRKYITTFVDASGAWYKENIEKLRNFSDGRCYVGYLWDCLLQKHKVISLEEVKRLLAAKPAVYVFWDIHSKDKISIPDYWKFPKSAVVEVRGTLLSNNFQIFPEDIYIFDETFMWSLILTHEYTEGATENINLYCQR